jgi:hypothetical protein
MGVVEWQEGAWHAGCRAGCECAVNAALFVGEWVALRSERLSASDSAKRPSAQSQDDAAGAGVRCRGSGSGRRAVARGLRSAFAAVMCALRRWDRSATGSQAVLDAA